MVNFTPEQSAAINYRGGALLVSAAAGSGKTKVLVERLLSRVAEGDNIDEFLVITYTRAAAFELRERIHAEIMNQLAKNPGNKRLRRQAMLSRCATIDTIHTFCSEILRENAHLAGLPSDFRVCDETESILVKNEVIEKVLDSAYERADEYDAFRRLIDMVIEGRNDRNLIEIIFDIHSRLQSTPNPHAWIKKEIESLENIENIADISNTVYGTQLMVNIANTVKFYQNEMEGLRELSQTDPDFDAKYGESIATTCEELKDLVKSLPLGWDEARKHKDIEFSRPKPLKGYEQEKAIRAICKEELSKCATILENSSAEHIQDMKIMAPILTALLMLVIDFDIAYAEEKKRRSIVDFSDLEHLTLSLLVDKESNQKTLLAQNISKRFKEVLVDEYQDVNAVQEQLFNAISTNGQNIFMVGDVKQSIYRFRLADPSIFLSKYKMMSEYVDEPDQSGSADNVGVKIHLSKNFRSRSEVLETVNIIFGNIMSEKLGEMEYTEKEMLVPGRGDGVCGSVKQGKQGKQGIVPIVPANTECELGADDRIPVEIDVVNTGNLPKEDGAEAVSLIEIEANHVTARISELVESGFLIPDSEGGKRKLEYSDIVILLRSVKGKAWKFAAELNKAGIPTNLPGGESFFESQEIRTILSMLTAINNPMQDIPLVATMSSAIYCFGANDLAQIRVNSKGDTFYEAVMKSAEHQNSGDELACKCKAFLDELDAYRNILPDMSADRFIWHVYNKTGLLDLAREQKNGDERCQNLISLADYASRYEQRGYKGLFMFLNHIQSLQERGCGIGGSADTGASDSHTDNSVRIMSIHKSKGMEFPVVFLVNTTSKFNYRDLSNPIVFHSKLGLGASLLDRERRIKYKTLPKIAIQGKLTSEMKSEELRVLYVAMTRAREKLIVTAAYKSLDSVEKRLSLLSPGKIPFPLMNEFNCMADWMLAGLQNEVSDAFVVNFLEHGGGSGSAECECEGDSSLSANEALSALPRHCEKQSDVAIQQQGQGREKPVQQIFEEVKSEQQDFDRPKKPSNLTEFNYPHEKAPTLPSKLTVTKLKQLAQDDDAQVAPWLREKQIASKPNFISGEQKPTATERGTLIHLVLQYAELEKCSNDDDVKKELQRLIKRGTISQEQANEIDINSIISFYNSNIGQRIIASDHVKKEFKFSLLTKADEYFPGGGSDKILLQGVVDCYFEENNELVVVDFKTDKVTEKTVASRADKYKPQLDAYANALERITGKTVKERIIYFFILNKEIMM